MGILPPPRQPKPAPPPRPVEPPSLWSPGDTAFWLDPHLWDRTPETAGKPELCWMHLDSPVLRRTNFNGMPAVSKVIPKVWGTYRQDHSTGITFWYDNAGHHIATTED